jgi:hypothetical protein
VELTEENIEGIQKVLKTGTYVNNRQVIPRIAYLKTGKDIKITVQGGGMPKMQATFTEDEMLKIAEVGNKYDLASEQDFI